MIMAMMTEIGISGHRHSGDRLFGMSVAERLTPTRGRPSHPTSQRQNVELSIFLLCPLVRDQPAHEQRQRATKAPKIFLLSQRALVKRERERVTT
jgi:hypothetical protein